MFNVPLEVLNLDEDGYHILVEMQVFGKSFKAVVDTGASKTVFDKSTVEAHLVDEQLNITDRVSTGLGTTSMESFTFTVPDLQIGDLHLRQHEVAVLDLSSINFAYQNMALEPVIGVIGGDILVKHAAIVDYGRQELKFRQKKRLASQRA